MHDSGACTQGSPSKRLWTWSWPSPSASFSASLRQEYGGMSAFVDHRYVCALLYSILYTHHMRMSTQHRLVYPSAHDIQHQHRAPDEVRAHSPSVHTCTCITQRLTGCMRRTQLLRDRGGRLVRRGAVQVHLLCLLLRPQQKCALLPFLWHCATRSY